MIDCVTSRGRGFENGLMGRHKEMAVFSAPTAVLDTVDSDTGDYSPPMERAMMNQLCKVCGDPAAGFHFGAFTCEGCKSFFGRTYNNLSSVSECKNSGRCVITKKNRTSCKACRLRKCIMVGMSKSGSRYGRRSNWFKIHCLLQEQQQAAQGEWGGGGGGGGGGHQTPDMPPGSTSLLSMTPNSAPSPPSPTSMLMQQKEGKEDYPFKGMSLSPLLPKEDRSPTAGATPVPHAGAVPGYDRNMLFSPLAPFMPSQQAALLNPAANPALLLARYRQNILLDALWSSAAAGGGAGGGGLPPHHPPPPPPPPPPSMSPMSQAMAHPPPTMPSIGLPAPEQDSPIDLSVKALNETTSTKGWNHFHHLNPNPHNHHHHRHFHHNNNKLQQPPSPTLMLNSAAAAKHLFGLGNPAAAAAGINPFDLARHQFPGVVAHPPMPPAMNLHAMGAIITTSKNNSSKSDDESDDDQQESDTESAASGTPRNTSSSTVSNSNTKRRRNNNSAAGFTVRPSSRSPGSPGSGGSSSDTEDDRATKKRRLDDLMLLEATAAAVDDDHDDDNDSGRGGRDDEDSDSDALSSSRESINQAPHPGFHSAPLDLSAAPNQISA